MPKIPLTYTSLVCSFLELSTLTVISILQSKVYVWTMGQAILQFGVLGFIDFANHTTHHRGVVTYLEFKGPTDLGP